MAKKIPRRSRFASEAAQQTLLRFGPQVDALNQVQSDAESAYNIALKQARGNADTTVATVDRAIPTVGGIYDRAGLEQARTASLVNSNIGALGGLNPNITAAVGLEQANASSRVSTGRAQSLAGLQDQRVAARAGGQYAANKAHDDLALALSKIFTQRQSLAAQSGTFQDLTTQQLTDKAQARADRLSSERATRAVTKRGQDLTRRGQNLSHQDRVAAAAAKKAAAKANTSATGQKLNTSDAHKQARDAVQKAISALGTLDPDRTDRHATAPLLIGGHKSQPLYDTVPAPTIANPKGTKQVPRVRNGVGLSTPDVPAVGEWATIAADVYYDGHLSRANQKRLSKEGYSIRQLGLPTYAEWRKSHPATKRSTTNYFGGAGAGSGNR